MTRTATKCPRCGWHVTIPIVHGQPRPDLKRVGIPKDDALRDWLIGMDHKDRVCEKCGHQWATGPGA
jgi:ribosomal protein S27AE